MTTVDLVDYRRPHSPFVDAFASFSVGLMESGIGLGPLHPRGVMSTYVLTEPTLEVVIDGTVPDRLDLVCLPHEASETGTTGGLRVRGRAVFADADGLVYDVEIVNEGPEVVSPELRFRGRGNADHPTYLLPFFPEAKRGARRMNVLADEVVEVFLVGDPAECDLPDVQLRIRCETDDVSAYTSPGDRYGFVADPRPITPGESVRFRFVLELTAGIAPLLPHRPLPDTDALAESRRSEWRAVLDGLPNGADGRLAARARAALMRTGLQGGSGEFEGSIASLCTGDRSDFSCSFFWDTLFSSVAIARFHPEFAKGAIRTAFVRQHERDGSSPERKWNHGVSARMLQQSPQSPVASWAVVEYLARHDDPAFLAEIYPYLVSNHRFWEEFSDVDRDGLSEYRWTGQVSDDSPIWDSYIIGGYTAAGCGWVPPAASVPLNCFLYKDAGHLADLARRLGRPEDERRFLDRRRAIGEAFHRHCYLPAERRYWDFDHHLARHERVRTFWMFWPLYAGMDVSHETARDLIENVLLDPAQFFGEVPFPSVAYDEPRYDPGGYWRGRTWPHVSYWLLETLWKNGYLREADEAADRLLEVWSRYEGFPENVPSDPGSTIAPGHLDYNWGAAAYLLTLERAYRGSLVTL